MSSVKSEANVLNVKIIVCQLVMIVYGKKEVKKKVRLLQFRLSIYTRVIA